MRLVDKAAAWLVGLLGLAHLAAGYLAFVEPTERRIWFMSAGFLLILTGLANLAAQAQATRMNSLAGAFGGASILVIGALLALANPAAMAQPQSLLLLALGVVLTARRLPGLASKPDRPETE